MVGFRAFATLHARRLGVRGWVRNTDDGGVEVLAEGTRAQVMDFVALLRRGPAAAQVSRFQVSEAVDAAGTGEFGPLP